MKKHLKIATLVALIGSGIDVALYLHFLVERIQYFSWESPLFLFLVSRICILVFFLVLFLAQSKRN